MQSQGDGAEDQTGQGPEKGWQQRGLPAGPLIGNRLKPLQPGSAPSRHAASSPQMPGPFRPSQPPAPGLSSSSQFKPMPSGPLQPGQPFAGPLMQGPYGPGRPGGTGQLPSGPLPPGPPALPSESEGSRGRSSESFLGSQFTSANLTRVLTAILPGVSESNPPPTIRETVMIKASMKRPEAPPPPLPPDQHKKRRLRVSLLGAGLLFLILLMALFSVTPLGHEIGIDNPLTLPNGNIITGQNPGLSNLVAQATATAVYHRRTDGFDPSSYGSQLLGNGRSSLGWPFGQCTYWANYEYHRLTGHWISWNGNADQWVSGARLAGWNVSSKPHVPSILVMMPYTQRASGYGHVAVVESASGNIVHTSNMNWWSNGGGWGRVSKVDFNTGRGIYFVWHS